MEFTPEQEKKINMIIEKITDGNAALKESPSIKVMAINLKNTYKREADKALKSPG
jgi:hypothetical protein